MPKSRHQVARLAQKYPALPVGQPSKPGKRLTIPASGGIPESRSGTIVRIGGIDISGYRKRDQELIWRDNALALAVEMAARRASSALGVPISFPKHAQAQDVIVRHSSSDTAGATVHQVMTISASGGEVKVNFACAVEPGSVEVYSSEGSAYSPLTDSVKDGNLA